MLSNTATPKYYGIFRDAVMRGEIPVNEPISLEMNRIEGHIRNPSIYYDPEPVEGFIQFCENELTLTDGGDLTLLLPFKVWAEQVFGWYVYEPETVFETYKDGRNGGEYVTRQTLHRMVTEQYLIVGRGAAKTVYAECIQAYMLVMDGTTTQQITTAPTLQLADEVLSPLRTAIIRAKGPLFKYLTMGELRNTAGNPANRVKLVATKKGIENFMTGSILEPRPMAIDKFQSIRPKVITIDEWLSCDIREDITTAALQSLSKTKESLLIEISSEGTVRNGPGDTVKMGLMKILKGEGPPAPHVSIWYYKLDSVDEVSDPNMWLKANPNLGATVGYDAYIKDVEKMEREPATRNDTLAKRFGIPVEGFTYFFTYEETLPHKKNVFWQMPCSMGADLSLGDDFCSFVFLFPLKDQTFGVKTRNYISQLTLDRLSPAARIKYEEFIREGSLVVMPGTVLDMMEVYENLDEHIIKNDYDVRAFGYDPYNAQAFVERWIRENGEYGVSKVRQGSQTESVPLGELKKLASERMLLFDEHLMSYAMGNAIALEDNNGNRKLVKKRHDQKIDAVAAMMDAFVAYKNIREDFD